MAYSAAALASAETTGFSADKPMMVVQQAGSPADAHWTYSGDHNTGADTTVAAYPASRAYDEIGNLVTRATAKTDSITAATRANPCVVTAGAHGLLDGDIVYIDSVAGMTQLNGNAYTVANKTTDTFQLSGVDSSAYGVYSSGGTVTAVKFYNLYFSTAINFDALLITGHNFNSGSFVSASLEIADNDAFTSNLIEIAKYTISGTTDNRILITNLNSAGGSSTYSAGGTAQRYSGAAYARLRVTHSGSGTPELGEIWLGYRYQLQRNPDIPWNNKNEASLAADYVSNSGITKRYTFYRGQALRTFQASIAAAAEITVIDGWFNAINEGTRPFVYIETPSSSAQAIIVMLDDAGLSFPLVGPTERRLAFSMTEQPPFLSRE